MGWGHKSYHSSGESQQNQEYLARQLCKLTYDSLEDLEFVNYGRYIK
jgi:hypothetical protein